MATLSLFAAVLAVVAFAGQSPPLVCDVLLGLRSLYDPICAGLLQALWLVAVFCWMGRSWVTDSTLHSG